MVKENTKLDEIVCELHKKIFQKNSDNGFSLTNFLNAPFTVTVLGGVLIWLLTAAWQHKAEEGKRVREEAARLFLIKQELLINFASNVPYTIVLAREYKKRETWLHAHKGDRSVMFDDGRSYESTRKIYEEKLDEYLRRKQISAYSAHIKSIFDSPETISHANMLSDYMNQFENIQGAVEDANRNIRLQLGGLEETYNKLIESMGAELH